MAILDAGFLGRVDYHAGSHLQVAVHKAVQQGADHQLLLLEHSPVYTLGKRGGREFILLPEAKLQKKGATIVQADRGGLVTFHGPGQLVGYPILHLDRLRLTLTQYVEILMGAVGETIRPFGLDAQVDPAAPGVYVQGRKIASVGVRKEAGVTRHGFALNLFTDLEWFGHIVACGLAGVSATSVLRETGHQPDMRQVGMRVARLLAGALGLELHWHDCFAPAVPVAKGPEGGDP